jgi:hypothetical protein
MSRKSIENNTGQICPKYALLCLCAAAIPLFLCRALYGESLGELTTTMAIEGKLMNEETRSVKTPEVDAVAQQGLVTLEKTAQKLVQSMQSGKFDQADFSAVWNNLIPQGTNFSDGINAMCKPVFEQFGNPEKLGQGTLAGPNRAVFPVQFTKGTLNMTISLDAQEKIVEWTLTPAPAPVPTQTPALETPAGGPKPETLEIPTEQPKEANVPDIDINDFNSFQRELNRMNIETRSEEIQWLGPVERKAELVRAIDELVVAELRFIRKLAESENAKETVKAVDLVLKQRRDRLNKLVTKLENETRQERQQQAAERRPRRSSRTAEGMDQPERRERPRRTREPDAAGQ